MTEPLHAAIFEDFRAAARAQDVYPNYQNTDRRFRQKFCTWQDCVGVHRLTFDDCSYDRAWLFVPAARDSNLRNPAFPESALRVYMVAVNSNNGMIALYTARWSPDQLAAVIYDHQWIGREIVKQYQPLSVTHGYISKNNNNARYAGLQPLRGSYGALRQTILSGIPALRDTFGDAADRVINRGKDMDIVRKRAAHDLALATFENHVPALFQTAFDEIERHLDLDALRAAENIQYPQAANPYYQDISRILYNHLMRAPSDSARYRRISVLPILARCPLFYIGHSAFWENIDNGGSPFASLGWQLKATPGTIRHMVRQGDAEQSLYFDHFEDIALYLDALPVNHWPKTRQETGFMLDVIKMARDYSTTFGQHSSQKILAQWAKDAGTHKPWRRIFVRKLRPHIVDVLHNPRWNHGNAISTTAKLRALLDDGSYRKMLIENHGARLESIADMKKDVARRLVMPAILRSTSHFTTTERWPQFFENLSKAATQKMWQTCPPSEQIAASAYWHSPRVDFSARFQAASRTVHTAWHTIFDTPLCIDGVIVAPLGSDAALREEAAAMDHCVWSYGPRCMEDGYHIFSLRDKNGNRLSTLSLVETRHDDGQVTFALNQNRSVSNQAPVNAAGACADSLCRMLNEGKIAIDWQPILADRAAYAFHQASGDVGYDFNDPVIAQEVFKLYEPCLPRKIARASGGTLDGFARALGIPDLIAAQLAPTGDGATLRPHLG